MSCPERAPCSSGYGVVDEAGVALIALRGDEAVKRLLRGGWLMRRFRHFHADDGYKVCLLALHVYQLGLSLCELSLKLAYLFLKLADRSRAPVHRVSDPGLSFIHHAAHGVGALMLRKFLIKKKNKKSSNNGL